MMEGIAAEYDEAITGPQSTRLYEAYKLSDRRYWVAHDGERVIGTVGLELLRDHNAVLKRMMTDKRYRGRGTGLAEKLWNIALDWGRAQGVSTIYLGTMSQFLAAQKFYAKHGCQQVSTQDLPPDMPVNPLDALHYRLALAQLS